MVSSKPSNESSSVRVFGLIWLTFYIMRALHVCVHYLRADPYGFPIVARVDRFLPFALLAVAGALLLVFVIAYLVSSVSGRLDRLKTTLLLGVFYLLAGLFDLEVYRYLKQHLSISYVKTYLKPSLVSDPTFGLVLKSDPLGKMIFIGFVVLLVIVIGSMWRSSRFKFGRISLSFMVLIVSVGSVLTASPYWLNPAPNRRNRISPPLSIMFKELYRTLSVSLYTTESEKTERVLRTFGHRAAKRSHAFVESHPLIHLPIEYACKLRDNPLCRVDEDGDGVDRSKDCDDQNPAVYPGASEQPSDGLDQNCDGLDAEPVNLIVLVVESLHRDLFMEQWAKPDRLKNIKRMFRYGGTLFSKAYGNGFPSVYGAASLYLGLWNPPSQSIFGEFAGHQFKGFPEYLPKELYAKHIVTAADPYFDNQAPWLQRYYDSIVYDRTNGNLENADAVAVDHAIHWLQQQPEGKPYLLTLNNHSTHMPFIVPADFKPEWQPAGTPQKYAKTLEYFDHHLGRILDVIETRSDFERTVVLMIGDHGFPVLEKDFKLPEFYGYQRSDIIAGIFSANPNFFQGSSVDHSRVVSQLDLGVTVLDLIGSNASHHFQGESWLRDSTRDAYQSVYMKHDAFSVHDKNRIVIGSLDSPSLTALRSSPTEEGEDDAAAFKGLWENVSELAKLVTFLVVKDRVWLPALSGQQTVSSDLKEQIRFSKASEL